ncbi:MAG TPA: hypothetical protein DEQ30_02910 [Porphyromonadaceae bacterium]|nr:hypothetical protein [Porphyromonadaceae bacterium]
MKTKAIYKHQVDFIETLRELDTWVDKFNFLIDLSSLISPVCSSELIPYRIAACQSRTYFRAWSEDGLLRVDGWSNTPVQRGIVASMIKMFDHVPLSEFSTETDIFFHKNSGLINNLTPLRQEGLKEMIKRIIVLYKDTK